MKIKLCQMIAGGLLLGGLATAGVAAADYCTSGALTRTTSDRYLTSFTLTDGSASVVVPVNQGRSYGSATYFDKTDVKLSVQPGATISFSALQWTGEWMHSYAYIDYDNDGEFNQTLNADGTSRGELVSYSYYNEYDTDGASAPNSQGVMTSRSSGVKASAMPSFTIPDDLAGGDYRMRFKVDWNSLDPCGATIQKDGGSIVDLIITVESLSERTVTVSSSDAAKGHVVIIGHEGQSVTVAGPVEVEAIPEEGYMFVNWTDASTGAVYSEQSKLRLTGGKDQSLVANFGDFAYPGMSRTFTNNSSQQNRYLGRVTTNGTETPEVFNAATQADLPFTNFTASAGTYVSEGALIDKTANPIKIEYGTKQFEITYYAWTQTINGRGTEMDWTQEAYFVDWNRNGSFIDEGEISEKGNVNMANAAILTGMTRTVNVPEGVAPGTYRMRVVFFEPASSGEAWPSTLFTTLARKIRNGISYDFDIEVLPEAEMKVKEVTGEHRAGQVAPGRKEVVVASLNVTASGTLNPLSISAIDMTWAGDANVSDLKWVYSTTGNVTDNVVATVNPAVGAQSLKLDKELALGNNYFILVANVADDAVFGSTLKAEVNSVTVGGDKINVEMAASEGIEIADIIDYTLGNALWFDTPNSSTAGVAIWNTNNFETASSNPDQVWERKSFPIGNGSFGGNVLGAVNRERVVLNEKTLWKGGPATGASTYWNMNNTVSETTLQNIRNYLANGSTSTAASMVSSNYKGKIDYTSSRFGSYTTMGEAYVSTGINESTVSNYKRIMNMDRSIVVVEFESEGTKYQRRYFCSYPDSVMVWRYTSEGEPQNLTFSFVSPQVVNSVTSPTDGSLLYNCKLSNNNMAWALRVQARTNDGGTVKADASARTITVSGSNDVEFILAGDTDYAMNFDPDITDANAFVGVNPVESVNAMVEKAAAKSYDELYDNHYADYSKLFDRVDLEINPSETFENLPTPTRLAKYRQGKLDHGLEQQYFQYGRYLLISSSRAGNMPANLQGMWHNNTEGPWRVDYHNNINLQMNYWPATCTNLLECFTPFIDYVRGLVKPGERTATAYYGARGWTAECSTNIFGFTAPLNSTDMSWNYNPTAGPWLATQIWEYYDYTRDKEWLREIGYPIIKSSANFVSDLLYLYNGTYTSAPSYSPEHGTADLGATYANAVTREVLDEAIKAAEILGDNTSDLTEWKNKLANMYPYQVGRYGQLQEWYNDIDTYNDDHRHTNHLFGLHPGTTINSLKDDDLVAACKETLKQRGDAATGWSMGWKLNHWARLLDGDHAYILFQNLLKDGTADNMWDLHPPFQIDGNFGGTAGVSELFLQSHNGVIHLLPALPSTWTDGKICGLRTRGNFEVDVYYAGGKLDRAVITSNAGEHCKVYYDGKEKEFDTVEGGVYTVTYDSVNVELKVEDYSAIDAIEAVSANSVSVGQEGETIRLTISGPVMGNLVAELVNISGQRVKTLPVNKTSDSVSAVMSAALTPGIYFLHVEGQGLNQTEKVVIK